MTTVIANRSRSVHADKVQGRRLSVIPILGSSCRKPVYRLLNEKSAPFIKVTEVSEGGSVPDLNVQNDLDEIVFLMDGQELVGAKQNRILNTDVMVAAKSQITIPVSCVEARRWRYTSPAFSAGMTASHRVRSSKHARVHQALKEGRRHDADQAAVWEDVNASLKAADVKSPTASMNDAYQARTKELADFRSSMSLPPNAVGVAVYRGREFFGLDLFDRHATLKHFWNSIVDSYAVDVSRSGEEDGADAVQPDAVTRVLEAAAAGRWEPFRSPGLGQDWRLEDPAFSGSALVWEDRTVIHLQVFARQGGGLQQPPVVTV